MRQRARRGWDPASGVALIMVLLVISALAIIAAPFAVSMLIHDRSSRAFEGEVKARLAAEGARNHAMARLVNTVGALESQAEAEELEALRPPDPSRRDEVQPGTRPGARRGASAPAPRRSRRPSAVRRADLGETADEGSRRRRSGNTQGRAVTQVSSGVDSIFLESKKGPSPKTFDGAEDLDVSIPGPVTLEDPEDPEASMALSSREVPARAEVEDEQGKINILTAPPNLVANLFGVSRLAQPLEAGATVMVLESAAPFRGDLDPKTLDGAVVVVHRDNSNVEAMTYRTKRGTDLGGLFRGAFLSLPTDETIPEGSFVYDLRGWKIGHHQLRSGAEGGFAPARLAEFASIEAIREIATWQIASLFVIRFRGEGLTLEFLQKNGITTRKLEELGLDPAIFGGDDVAKNPYLKAEFDLAVKSLRRLRVGGDLLESLRKSRGERGVIAFESRVTGMKAAEVRKAAEELKKTLERDRRNAPRFERKYLEAAIADMAESYKVPGIETVLPEELEIFREAITVSSQLSAKWSEAQSNPDPLPAGMAPGESFRAARPGELGGGALVRIRSRLSPDLMEFNRVIHRGKNVPVAGYQLAWPLLRSYGAHGVWIDALQRHPVNVNSASEKVLEALFTGVQGFKRTKEGDHTVSPQEAGRLASLVRSKVPLKWLKDFQNLLIEAAQSDIIDGEDIEPLMINAIQPNDPRLKTSTTGLCYATGDVYTIESRGVLRSDAGGTVAAKLLREIVEVSAPGPLRLGLFSQADYADGLYIEDPRTPFAPEDHALHAVGFPGTRAHLVFSTPLLLWSQIGVAASGGGAGRFGGGATPNLIGAPKLFPLAGGEVGTLRLAISESNKNGSTYKEIQHFEGTPAGLELGPGEPFVVDISLAGQTGGAAGAARGGVLTGTGAGGTGAVDLTNLPASVDFWVRFRTYPEAVSREGMAVLIDAGMEEERNRICLLYDKSRSEFVARLYDSSLPDPSIIEGRQFVEVRARRPLDLETWYHLRLAWDGTYAGGLQLFIDGLPAGRSTIVTELAADMQAQGSAAVALKDRSVFPVQMAGVEPHFPVRVGDEIIDIGSGGQIFQRRQPVSFYRQWLATQNPAAQQAGQGLIPVPGSPQGQGPTTDPVKPGSELMRAPWNNRGSAPGHHNVGTPVELHGYSLQIRRKLRDLRTGINRQAAGNEPVWMPGGLTLADRLYTWNRYPPEVESIVHFGYVKSAASTQPGTGGGPGGIPGVLKAQAPPGTGTPAAGSAPASATQYIAPVFRIRRSQLTDNIIPGVGLETLQPWEAPLKQFNLQLQFVHSAEIQWGGQTYNAADFFQKEGVLVVGNNVELHYTKEPLPPDHPGAVVTAYEPPVTPIPGGMRIIIPQPLLLAQRQGLKIVRWGPISGNQAQAKALVKSRLDDPSETIKPISVLANGPASNLYPPTGILEVRGKPAPWDQGRPDLSAAPLFGNHPEDTVEWIRYGFIYNSRIFVGWLGNSPNFRGYPRDELISNQMFHNGGEALRLVMELADGGAGYGDYVTIATNDPRIGETQVRRVYSASERDDGRFFVSLVDVDGSGNEAMSVRPYLNTYTVGMNPRLVKFPGGPNALPQMGTGRMVFFGEAISGTGAGTAGAAGAGAGAGGGGGLLRTSIEEEPTAGTVLDEVRLSMNPMFRGSQGNMRDFRYVLVPMEGGAVRYTQTGSGTATITGVIPAGQSVSPEKPLEILVVSLGNMGLQRRVPPLFAAGMERGLLRIGDELFFFENPETSQNQSARAQGGAQGGVQIGHLDNRTQKWEREQPPADFVQMQNNRYSYEREMRFSEDRSLTWRSPAAAVTGSLEKGGFLRVDDTSPDLNGFYEIFYYRQYSGSRFEGCLRGRFQTPIVLSADSQQVTAHPLYNVTTRLRLLGRSLLGTEAATHGMGDPVALMPYLDYTQVTGPLTGTGIAVKEAKGFAVNGYLLMDQALPGLVPFEILAYMGLEEGLFRRPQDEAGKGILRSCFGTPERPIHPGMFAYGMPFRHYDRYQALTESESLAYLQKSFRVSGAHWRSLQWRERRPRSGKERLCDVVVAARLDGAPDWAEKPTNEKGGLFVFEKNDRGTERPGGFAIDAAGDELEVRIYFRYKSGSFQRVSRDILRDDWKETPILEWLAVEYEKAGRILRHEEPPY